MKNRFGLLVSLCRNAPMFARLFSNDCDKRIRSAELLLRGPLQKKLPIYGFVLETLADACLKKAESVGTQASDIVSAWPFYRKALENYTELLGRETRSKDKDRPINLFRAAKCCCRLGDFQSAIHFLEDSKRFLQNPSPQVDNLLRLCLSLSQTAITDNLWTLLAASEKQASASGLQNYLSASHRAALDEALHALESSSK